VVDGEGTRLAYQGRPASGACEAAMRWKMRVISAVPRAPVLLPPGKRLLHKSDRDDPGRRKASTTLEVDVFADAQIEIPSHLLGVCDRGFWCCVVHLASIVCHASRPRRRPSGEISSCVWGHSRLGIKASPVANDYYGIVSF
jgi:hypothetical protein